MNLKSEHTRLETRASSGRGQLQTTLPAGSTFSVSVKPATEGSIVDGWSYSVSIQTTKKVEKAADE